MRPPPFVHLCPDISDRNILQDFLDIRRRNSFNKTCKSVLRENQLCDSHVVSEGINQTSPVFSHFFSIWIKLGTRDVHKNVLSDGEFRSNRRSEKPYFTLGRKLINFNPYFPHTQGPGQRSRYSDSLLSGDRIPGGGARFSAPVQTGPGAHPASSTMGTGSFAGVKRQRRGVDHPPYLAPRLKKEQSNASAPHLGLRGMFWGEPLPLRSTHTHTNIVRFG